MGGWHFLNGGISGIQDIEHSPDCDSLEWCGVQLTEDHTLADETIQLQPGSECDSFSHYMLSHEAWKARVEGEVADGEYQYWTFAAWQGNIDFWDSVRDWVASLVEMVEEMVEYGEVNYFEGRGEEESGEESEETSDEEKTEAIRGYEERDDIEETKGRENDGEKSKDIEEDEDWEKIDVLPDEGDEL